MMRSTSTKWFNIINYDDFAIYFAKSLILPELIQTFSRYSNPIGLSFENEGVESIMSHNCTMLASLTNLTKLEFNSHKIRLLQLDPRHFSTLTNLQRFSISVSIAPYLQYFTNLTKLVIPRDYYLDPNHLDKLQYLTKLQKFQFVLYKGKTEINVISKLGNPSLLKSLNINDEYGRLTFDSESVMKMSRVSKVSIVCSNVLFPVSKLPNLESLSISSDRFDDFSTCTKLTKLEINAPEIPSHDFQQLTALYKLKYLSLRSNLKDDQFEFLSKMTDLESLSIEEKSDVELTGQYLEYINSSRFTKVTTPALAKAEFMSHLTSLEEIRLDTKIMPKVTNPFELRNVTCLVAPDLIEVPIFPNLKKFKAPYVAGGFAHVSQLTLLSQLESLDLNRIIDIETFLLIAKQTRLTELRIELISSQDYNFEVLDRLTNLKILELKMSGKRRILPTDVIWEPIASLTNLEELNMFQIDEKSVASVKKLPKLKKLYLTGEQVANFDERNLSGLTDLKVVKLSSPVPPPPMLPFKM